MTGSDLEGLLLFGIVCLVCFSALVGAIKVLIPAVARYVGKVAASTKNEYEEKRNTQEE